MPNRISRCFKQGQGYAVNREAVDEIGRSVQRIQDPAERGGPPFEPPFLDQEIMIRKSGWFILEVIHSCDFRSHSVTRSMAPLRR